MDDQRAVRLQRLSKATKAAEQAWKDAMSVRDREVDDADAAGMPIREIARNCDLAPQTIERILARVERARQS